MRIGKIEIYIHVYIYMNMQFLEYLFCSSGSKKGGVRKK